MTRRYDAPGGPIDYEAPIERCLGCDERFSGPAAAEAELRAIKACPDLCPWDESLQAAWERHVEKKERPTVIDGAEVFDSEGTLSLTINGYDILYLTKVVRDPEEPDHPVLTDEQHQRIIDGIVEAL